MSTGTSGPGLATVELLGLPVALQARATEHSQELRREFVLIADGLQHSAQHPALPRRLLALIDTLQQQYGGYTLEQEDELEDALAAGVTTLDLTFRVPPDVAAAAVQLEEMLEEADEYCREGRHLLTLATPPELVTFRRWYLQQFVDQIGGRAPTAWAGPLA